MVDELCDLDAGVLGRLPDGAEDVIDAVCTFQAEGIGGLSTIIEERLRDLEGKAGEVADGALGVVSGHLTTVLAPFYDITNRVIKLSNLADIENLFQGLCNMGAADRASLSPMVIAVVDQACQLKASELLQLGGDVARAISDVAQMVDAALSDAGTRASNLLQKLSDVLGRCAATLRQW